MDETKKLLECVSYNARIGLDSVRALCGKTDDEVLKNELYSEEDTLIGILRRADDALSRMGETPPSTASAKVGMWFGLQKDTLTDKSREHLADMLIQGNTMGIIEITKARGKYPAANQESQKLACDLLTHEQDSVDRLKNLLATPSPVV